MKRYLTGFGEGCGYRWKQYSDGTIDYDQIDMRGCTVASWTEKIADTATADSTGIYKPMTGNQIGDALLLALLLTGFAWTITHFDNKRRKAREAKKLFTTGGANGVGADAIAVLSCGPIHHSPSASRPYWAYDADYIGRAKAEIAQGVAPGRAQDDGSNPLGLEAR